MAVIGNWKAIPHKQQAAECAMENLRERRRQIRMFL